MFFKRLLVLSAAWFLFAGPLEAKEICLTFERLPAMKPLGFWTPRELSNMILRVLKAHSIQAVGFVQEEKIDDDPSSYVVLQDWIENGHLLGNNTYSYVDLNELTPGDFLAHVADGQKYILRASRIRRTRFRYFRFPMLHHGDTSSKRNEVAKVLRRADYVVVPATVVLSDFSFNRPFVETEQGSAEMDRLKHLYLEHFTEALNYAEQQSERVFGRQIRQILRLHLGIATANFLDDLIEVLKEKDYTFISLQDALEDPAYETEEDYAGPLGLSFIDRVAATQGLSFTPDHGYVSATEVEKKLKVGPSENGLMR